MTLTCYQCERETAYLFADSRCCDCTRLTVEQVTGEPSGFEQQEEILVCTACDAEYPMQQADDDNWEYCPKCGETFL
jgi:rRNA maturation endonuclease Nob1